MKTYSEWRQGQPVEERTIANYELYQRREQEPLRNAAARFHPGHLEPDGETFAYPCIEISGAQVYAYVQDGCLVVSVDLDGAQRHTFDIYGEDERVPVRVRVQDSVVFEAREGGTPEPLHPGISSRLGYASREDDERTLRKFEG